MCGYNVCNDLMVEIFERLPSESIIRFRSLSKYWHSRLASPEFIRHHCLRRSKHPPKLLIRHLAYDSVYTLHTGDQMRSGYLTIPGVKLPWEHKRTEVVGSCNGILCLRDNYNFILWNLSIRRKLDVPPPHPRLKAEFAVGFGFDPITDDYKIVAMSCDKSEPASDRDKTFIYSLKTESWSAIPSPSSRFLNLNEKRSSEKAWFSNGILHWVLHGYLTVATTEDLSLFTLTFNLSSHVFGHIVFPEPRNITQLTNINGCLAAVSWEIDGVWIRAMKEHDKTESWSWHSMDQMFGIHTYVESLEQGCVQSFGNVSLIVIVSDMRFIVNVSTMRFIRMWKALNCWTTKAQKLVEKPLRQKRTLYGECILL